MSKKNIFIIIWRWLEEQNMMKITEGKILFGIKEDIGYEKIISQINSLLKEYNNDKIILMCHFHKGDKGKEKLFNSIKTNFNLEDKKIRPFGKIKGEIYWEGNRKTGFLVGRSFVDGITERNFDHVWEHYWENKDEKKKVVLKMATLLLHLERLIKFNNFEETSLDKAREELKSLIEAFEGEERKENGWKYDFPEIEDVWKWINGINIESDGPKIPKFQSVQRETQGDLDKIKKVLEHMRNWAG